MVVILNRIMFDVRIGIEQFQILKKALFVKRRPNLVENLKCKLRSSEQTTQLARTRFNWAMGRWLGPMVAN